MKHKLLQGLCVIDVVDVMLGQAHFVVVVGFHFFQLRARHISRPELALGVKQDHILAAHDGY